MSDPLVERFNKKTFSVLLLSSLILLNDLVRTKLLTISEVMTKVLYPFAPKGYLIMISHLPDRLSYMQPCKLKSVNVVES